MNFIKIMLRSSVFLAIGLAVSGCAKDGSANEEFFEPNDEHRKINQIINAQADNGAQDDATLQPHHFSGRQLNALGMEKLDRMLPDEPDADVVVYLDLPSNDLSEIRKDDVIAYLGESGVALTHVKVESGSNPDTASPSAGHLARLSKTDVDLGADVGGTVEPASTKQ